MNMHKRILSLLWLALVIPAQAPAAAGAVEPIPYGDNPRAGHFAEVNGIRMYYEIYGEGPPLLLIHGNGQRIADMHFQVAEFAKTYRVIVTDSRAHGKSGLGTDHLTYTQMMADYNALLDHLGVSGAHLVGWSDGGILALLLAISHPDKVGKMVIMGSNLRPDQTAVKAWVPGLLDPLSEQVDEMLASGDSSEDWALLRQLLDLLLTQPDIPVESLQKITAPVLVVAGDDDIIRGEHTLEIFENLPRAHLAIMPGQTHYAPATDPDAFNALVTKFLATPFTRPTSEELTIQAMNPPAE